MGEDNMPDRPMFFVAIAIVATIYIVIRWYARNHQEWQRRINPQVPVALLIVSMLAFLGKLLVDIYSSQSAVISVVMLVLNSVTAGYLIMRARDDKKEIQK
jgi:uncharacterized membrane protein